MRKQKIVDFVKNHEYEILGSLGAIIGILVYTQTCKVMGYRMVTPYMTEDGVQKFRTISGDMLKVSDQK